MGLPSWLLCGQRSRLNDVEALVLLPNLSKALLGDRAACSTMVENIVGRLDVFAGHERSVAAGALALDSVIVQLRDSARKKDGGAHASRLGEVYIKLMLFDLVCRGSLEMAPVVEARDLLFSAGLAGSLEGLDAHVALSYARTNVVLAGSGTAEFEAGAGEAIHRICQSYARHIDVPKGQASVAVTDEPDSIRNKLWDIVIECAHSIQSLPQRAGCPSRDAVRHVGEVTTDALLAHNGAIPAQVRPWLPLLTSANFISPDMNEGVSNWQANTPTCCWSPSLLHAAASGSSLEKEANDVSGSTRHASPAPTRSRPWCRL